MDSEFEKLDIFQIIEGRRSNAQIVIAREFPLTIILNEQELVTLLCSPTDLNYLAVGYLSSEGFIKTKDQIKNVMVDDARGVVRVTTTEVFQAVQDALFKRLITSGCGRGTSFYNVIDVVSPKVISQMKITADAIFELVTTFQHCSKLYQSTHGVHSAALCDNHKVLVFSDDIGRHNAIDRIFGKCLLEDIPTDGHIILTSGRVSSEILHKIAKRGIPVIVSISVPTDLSVKIAESLGITLVGGVRGRRRMNIYTNDWRVV